MSRFPYLKELVIPKVRLLIDRLPFTSEGYTRAKSILMTKYGRPSEVANAHVRNIMSLLQISNANPQKIHEFSEKLLCSVQALDTMGKIKEMNGYVRVTLNKLQGIRADLVRNDDNWQDWKFQQLVEALEKWAVRNPTPLVINEIQKKVMAMAKVTRLNKLRVNVCTVRNLTIDLLIVKLQKP